MLDFEDFISWLGSFLILFLIFIVLNKIIKKSNPLSFLLKLITIGLCFYINLIFSSLLHESIMHIFNINTDGFMNLNGILTFSIVWLAIVAIVFIASKAIRKKLGFYYQTIRNTQIAFFVLPFLIVFLFLMVAS